MKSCRIGSPVLKTAFCICGGIFDLETKQKQVDELQELMGSSSFWDDPGHAQKVISETNQLKEWTLPYYEVKERFSNVEALYPEAETSGDQELIDDLLKELDLIEKKLSELEI